MQRVIGGGGGVTTIKNKGEGAGVYEKSLQTMMLIRHLWKERRKEGWVGRPAAQTAVKILESLDQAKGAPGSKVCPLEESCVEQAWLSSSIPALLSYWLRAAQGPCSFLVMDTSTGSRGTVSGGHQLTILSAARSHFKRDMSNTFH